VWHVSLAFQRKKAPLLYKHWKAALQKRVVHTARGLLDGVGQEPDLILCGNFVYHLRRALTDAEMSRLDPAWLTLPAVDDG
jgi:hypothetical protein